MLSLSKHGAGFFNGLLIPPRLPRPLPRQRSFRRPPVPRITGPSSGCATRSFCRSRYSSSDNNSRIRAVKARVSTITTVSAYVEELGTSMAYGGLTLALRRGALFAVAGSDIVELSRCAAAGRSLFDC